MAYDTEIKLQYSSKPNGDQTTVAVTDGTLSPSTLARQIGPSHVQPQYTLACSNVKGHLVQPTSTFKHPLADAPNLGIVWDRIQEQKPTFRLFGVQYTSLNPFSNDIVPSNSAIDPIMQACNQYIQAIGNAHIANAQRKVSTGPNGEMVLMAPSPEEPNPDALGKPELTINPGNIPLEPPAGKLVTTR